MTTPTRPSFFRTPRQWTPRRWLFQLHLYAGVIVGGLALAIGLSGAALVYSPELELTPRWASAPAARPMPLADLSRTVMAGFPGFRLHDIGFNTAGDATVFHVQREAPDPPAGTPKPKRRNSDLRAVVDPETGAVLKVIDHHAGPWHLLRELHHDLLAAKTGRLVNGLGALALFALCLTGMAIWWPGPSLWKRRLGITRGAGWKRVNWDLHNAAGFWLAAGLAFFSFTGFQYAFPGVTKGALRWATGSPERPSKPLLEPTAAGATLDVAALVQRASVAVPDGRVRQIKFPKKAHEPVEARVKTPFDGHHEGNTRVFLHRATGEVVLVDRFDRLSPAGRAIELLEPLHNARFMSPGWGSVVLRLPWIVMGLAPGLLFVTGFLMWWNRVVSKRRAAIASPARAPSRRQLAGTAGTAAVLLLCASPAPAQNTVVRGRVLDATGAAIVDARVTLGASAERTTRTGADGGFEFVNVAPGEHLVSVEAPGFEVQAWPVRTGQAHDFRLDLAPLIEEITVNAGTIEQRHLDEPLVSTAIGRRDIASRNNRRLSDVVARMPGVFLTGPPGGEKDVRVRGLDKEYSRAQIDGLTIPDGGEKRELQLNRIPSSVVETVRLVRNPTAEYESDGFAGRIDVQTRGVPAARLVSGRLGYGARRARENGVAQGQFALGAPLTERIGFFAGYNLIDDSLPIGRTKVLATRNRELEDEHRDQRSGNFFGDVSVRTGYGDLRVRPVVLGLVTDMSKVKWSTSSAGTLLARSEESEHKSQQGRGLSVTHQIARPSGLLWETQAGRMRGTEDKDKLTRAFKVTAGAFAPDKRTPEVESKTDRATNLASSLGMSVRAGVWHDLKAGAAVRLRDRARDKTKVEIDLAGNSKDTSTPKDRYHLSERYTAGFAQDRLRLTDSLSLMPGLRIEHVRLESGTPATARARRTFLDVNPSLHLLSRLTDSMSLRAAVSRGLARPKFDELSPYEVESATKITIGNPDLDPTRAWSVDAGVDYATSMLTLSANAFYKDVTGVIEEVDTGLDRDTRDIYQVRNVGDGWVRGLELEGRLRMPDRVHPWARPFSVWANQTFLSSRLRAATGLVRPFKEQPVWIANIGLDYNADRTGTSVSLIANVLADRYDHKPAGDITAKRGSTNLDMAVYQRLRGNWRFFVEANNLTNTDRTEHEVLVNGTENRRTEVYGRTVLAGVQFGL